MRLRIATIWIEDGHSFDYAERCSLRYIARQPARATGLLGYSVFSADFNSIDKLTEYFDAICVLEGFECEVGGVPILARCAELLKPAGLMIGFLRNSGRAKNAAWSQSERYFFPLPQLQLLLEKCGYRDIWISELDKGGFVTCLKSDRLSKQRLSIIMPVYNERSTFEQTVKEVLNKRVAGISEKELIIVESNSTDGTRELVRQYEDHPEVKVIYEQHPQGKGHAVRTGLIHASGEFIMIQDADSEYDVNDYDELVKPLVEFKEPFVLGSRHKGDFKMRSFTNEPLLALLFNFGQILLPL